MGNFSLIKFHKLYIQNTEEKALVVLKAMLLCDITNAVAKAIDFSTLKVHVTTRMLNSKISGFNLPK